MAPDIIERLKASAYSTSFI